MSQDNSLSVQEAFEFCKQYRAEHKVRMFSQCWGCLKFSKGTPEKMCFHNSANNEGCRFVSQIAQQQKSQEG